MTDTQTFMDLALEEARVAAEAGEVPIGCVIVCDEEVIAQSGNRTLAERDPTAHAEMVAIRRAAEALGSARIRRLYYGAADPKGGAVENGVRYFCAPTCLHRPDVYGGIGESEAAALLRGFFAVRR